MKKTLLIALCLSSVMLLCSWSEKKIELLDDSKLIDLDKAIEYAKPGSDISSDSSGDGSSDNTSDSEDETPDDTQNPNSEKTRTIVISIRDEEITYDGLVLNEFDELEKKIRWDSKGKVKFSLIDNYAEAHVYKKTIKELKSYPDIEFSYQ